MKLLGRNKSKIIKDENGENLHHLEFTVVSIYCNIVSNDYHQDSRVLYTFALNNTFGQSVDISPKSFIIWTTFNSECSYNEV